MRQASLELCKFVIFLSQLSNDHTQLASMFLKDPTGFNKCLLMNGILIVCLFCIYDCVG